MGIGPREGLFAGANLGRVIVTNGDFTASVCDSASTVEAALWDGVCGGPRLYCRYYMGVRVVQGEGVWRFLFSIFTMGNAIASPTGFLVTYSVSRSNWGFVKN